MTAKMYEFFVDGAKLESASSSLTGAQLKSIIPGFNPAYGLWEEGKGNEPDRPIRDEDTISLEKEKGPRRFYTVPPATFGSNG